MKKFRISDCPVDWESVSCYTEGVLYELSVAHLSETSGVVPDDFAPKTEVQQYNFPTDRAGSGSPIGNKVSTTPKIARSVVFPDHKQREQGNWPRSRTGHRSLYLQ